MTQGAALGWSVRPLQGHGKRAASRQPDGLRSPPALVDSGTPCRNDAVGAECLQAFCSRLPWLARSSLCDLHNLDHYLLSTTW